MMKQFDFTSGTSVLINESYIEIVREGGKSVAKALFAGRVMGKLLIKKSALTGVIFNGDYLIICASGFPTPNDFKATNTSDVKQYPNCIVAKEAELNQLYNELMLLF